MLLHVALVWNAAFFGFSVAMFLRFPKKRRWPVSTALTAIGVSALLIAGHA